MYKNDQVIGRFRRIKNEYGKSSIFTFKYDGDYVHQYPKQFIRMIKYFNF